MMFDASCCQSEGDGWVQAVSGPSHCKAETEDLLGEEKQRLGTRAGCSLQWSTPQQTTEQQ
jgi:hypothetical protein